MPKLVRSQVANFPLKIVDFAKKKRRLLHVIPTSHASITRLGWLHTKITGPSLGLLSLLYIDILRKNIRKLVLIINFNNE